MATPFSVKELQQKMEARGMATSIPDIVPEGDGEVNASIPSHSSLRNGDMTTSFLA